MKLVAHISDAHFGAHDSVIAAALLDELNSGNYRLIAFSGDLTQRARVQQFQAARMWLDRLVPPWLAVPGNHDIPLYDIFRRFLAPRDHYLEHICDDLEPCFADDEIAMCGIDTTKTFTTKHGRVSRDEIVRVAERLSAKAPRWKILVAHHPFFVPAGRESDRVQGADEALPILEDAGVDLILSGHLHTQSVAGRNEHHSILAAQAGTCMSTRLRGEAQGFNQLRFNGDELSIVNRVWDGGRFVDGALKTYRRTDGVEHIIKVADVPASPELPHL
jgi:3',5'-cyclic AMP phosphodiesterase CpdA